MFGFGKDNLVVGIYIVGTNKSLDRDKLQKKLYNFSGFTHYKNLLGVKMAEIETRDGMIEWYVTPDIVKSVMKTNKGVPLLKTYRDIAVKQLSNDYKGFGDDLVDTLVTCIILIFIAVAESLEARKVGSVSMVVEVPKYVTMLLDKDAEKHNSINWLIDNNSLVYSIYSAIAKTAYDKGYKGDILSVLRWTDV